MRLALVGVALGALGGASFLGIELGVLFLGGMPVPADYALFVEGLTYLILGGTAGGFLGAMGLEGIRWATAATISLAAWLAVPIAATSGGEGVQPILGLLVLAVGGAVAILAGRIRPLAPQLLRGALVGSFTAMALGVPVNQHLLAHPADALSLTVDLLVAAVALVAGSLAAIRRGEGAPWVSLGLLGALGWAAVAAFLLIPPTTWPRATGSDRSLVLIVVSGLRADHLGAFGYPHPTTPNIDRAGGLRFSDVQSTAPWTIPAFGTLMTGKLPYDHGAGLNTGVENGLGPLRSKSPTLARMLRDEGYVTAAVTGDPTLHQFGFDAGFDLWRGGTDAGAMPAWIRPWTIVAGDPLLWPLRLPAPLVTEQAIDYVRGQRRSGWFLLVHYVDAAGPFMFDARAERAVGAARRHWNTDAYDAALRRVDSEIGKLLAELPSGTRVAIVGDRGVELDEERGASDLWHSGHTMHQELLRVPLILLGAGSGTVSRPTSSLEILPTLLAWVGVRPAVPLDADPVPELGGRQRDTQLVSQSIRVGAEQQSIRVGRWKLIRDWRKNQRLYDLEADPNEVKPLGAEGDVVERELSGRLPAEGWGARHRVAESPAIRMGDFLVGRWRRTPFGARTQTP